MKTLNQILEATKNAHKDGIYGIDACKESILSNLETDKKYNIQSSLYTKLEEYVDKANKNWMFNENMVQACWQLINNK